MHSHHNPNDSDVESSFWQRAFSWVPLIGSVIDPHNKNIPQKIDAVFAEGFDYAGQYAVMNYLPGKLTNTIPFPEVSKNMETQMEIKMFAEMMERMVVGSYLGRLTYSCISQPIKLMINSCKEGTFNGDAKDFAVKIAQMIPIIGSFLGEQDWKKAMKKGMLGSAEQLSMVAAGSYAMMLSPTGMEPGAVSFVFMVGGMAADMAAIVIMKELGNKGIETVRHCSLFANKTKPEDQVKLLDLEAQRESNMLSELRC